MAYTSAYGDVCLAHSITDGGSGGAGIRRSSFPLLARKHPLITEDRPADNYAMTTIPKERCTTWRPPVLRRRFEFTHLERVHCLKVVSDNRAQPLSADRAAKRAPDLMATCLPVLDKLIRHMHELNDAVAQRTTLPTTTSI